MTTLIYVLCWLCQTKTHDLSNTLKSLRAFRTVPSRRVAAAPTKNSENNPMQSSRTAAATDGLDRNRFGPTRFGPKP